jgi:membrane protein
VGRLSVADADETATVQAVDEPPADPADAPSESAPAKEQRPRSILVAALRDTFADNLTNVAAGLAYYAFLAIPSAALIAVGVFSLVASPSDVPTLLAHLGNVMPQSAIALLDQSLTRTAGAHNGGITLLVIGGLLALWTLIGAMTTLMWGLNIAFDARETRGFFKTRLIAVLLLVFTLISFMLVFGLLVLGPHLSGWVGDAVGQRSLVQWIWWIAEWPILLIALFFTFAAILYLGPNRQGRRWKWISVGAVFAVVIWLVASGAFAFYASNFSSYNKTWGSLAAVIIMLTWLWLSGLALLIGAEIDATAEERRAP